MGALVGPDFPTDFGVAVSGGGDSMAMLHLAAGWARVYGIRLWPVTVDPMASGLKARPRRRWWRMNVRDWACRTPCCAGSAGTAPANLQDAARTARRDLIGRWRGVCTHVLMAHTQDDQAKPC